MVTKALELEQINAALMALPKWDTMTDGSQAMVKKIGLFGLASVLLLAFSKMLLPLALLGGGGYIAWRTLERK